MALKLTYATKEEVPVGFESLYTETDGVYNLTGVEGMKTDEDISKLQTALSKERTAHREARQKLTAFGDMDAADARAKLDKFDELEIAARQATGPEAEKKLADLVEARMKTQIAPLQREKDALTVELTESTKKVVAFETSEKTRTIKDTVLVAAKKAGIVDTAMDDVALNAMNTMEIVEGKVLTVEGSLSPDGWVTLMKKARPHWWPASRSAGAGGNDGRGGTNPWAKENWSMTDQGQFVKAHGMERATEMAKLAGVGVGSTKPVEK